MYPRRKDHNKQTIWRGRGFPLRGAGRRGFQMNAPLDAKHVSVQRMSALIKNQVFRPIGRMTFAKFGSFVEKNIDRGQGEGGGSEIRRIVTPEAVQWIFSVDWTCCFLSYSPDFANE